LSLEYFFIWEIQFIFTVVYQWMNFWYLFVGISLKSNKFEIYTYSMKKYSRALILGHLRDLIVIVIIGDVISFFFNPSVEVYIRYLWLTSIYCLFIGGTLWKGNQLVSYLIHRRVDSYKEPVKALWWHLSMAFLFTVTNIVVVNYLWWI